MKAISRISLYLLGLLALLNFFSPSYPAWSFARAVPWPLCLAGAAAILVGEWKRRAISAQIPSPEWKESSLHLLIIIAGITLIHLFLLANPYATLNSDTEMSVVAARAIVQDGARPVYIFNQFYQGVPIAYFYALFMPLVGDLHLAVYFVSLIFLSLGVFFLSQVFRRVTGTAFYWILLAISLWTSMQFIATDATHGFPLVFCLLAFIIHELHAVIFLGKNRFFAMGTAGGLLFFQYQQAFPLLVFFFLGALISRMRKGVVPAAGTMAAGFVLGSFPHLLAEVYDCFLNSSSMFLSKSGSLLKNIFDLKNMAAHFFFHPLQIESGILSLPLLLLFLAGLAVSLYLGLKKKKGAFLLLPGVYLLVVLISTMTGVPPTDPRFGMHFRVYTPLALILATVPFAIFPLFQKIWLRGAILTVFLLANGFRFLDEWNTRQHLQETNLQTIRLIDSSPARLIFGKYWSTKRFQTSLRQEQIIIPSSSLLLPGVYRSPGQYQPDYLKACRLWSSAEKGYLTVKSNKPKLIRLLGLLGIRCHSASARLSTLLYRFQPEPSLELFHYLSLVEMAPKLSEQKAVSLMARPWEEIESIGLEGLRLVLRLKTGVRTEGAFSDWRLSIEHGSFSLETPLVFHDGRMECRIPEHVAAPFGACTLTYTWKRFVRYRCSFALETGNNGRAPMLQLDVADRECLFFHLKRATETANRAADFGLRFSPLAPADRLFSGVKSEIRAPGLPLRDESRVRILDARVRRVKIAMISLLDFDSLVWSKRFSQCIEVVDQNDRRLDLIRLKPGFNEITISGKEGDLFRLRSTWSSFFASEDSAGNMSLPRTGVLLLKFTCLDAEGKTLAEISPFLTVAGT